MIDLMSMFPVLVTEDLASIKAFYEAHFGFTTQFYDASFYLHLLHPGSGAQLGFMVPNHATQPEFLHPIAGKQGMVISFEVQNAEMAFETAMAAGLDIFFDLKKEAFGLSHFMVKDPGGFVVDVVEHHQP